MRCGLGPTNDFPGRIPALDISQVSTGLTRCDLNEFFHVYEGSREDIYYGLKCIYLCTQWVRDLDGLRLAGLNLVAKRVVK